MNHDLVEIFRKKLNSLDVADYHGLISPGLTCYLNSVLQVLFMTGDFREAVTRCNISNPSTLDPYLGRLFANLEKDVARTHRIAETLGITDVYKQSDAAEYFEKILSLCCPETSTIFKGELIQKTTCLVCNEGNSTRSCFWVLPLPVEKSRHRTYRVDEGLSGFFEKTKVFGDNRMHCSRCDELQEAELECEMSRLPEVLTLMLKRFCFSHSRGRYLKLHCRVDVARTLHVQGQTYELYAVVDHYGDLSGGHYTAQVQSFENRKWYCFNDDTVKMLRTPPFQAEEKYLRSRTAYLLTYRKLSRCQTSEQTEGCDEEDARKEDTPIPPHPPQDGDCIGGEKITVATPWSEAAVGVEETSIRHGRGACRSNPSAGEALQPANGHQRSCRDVAKGENTAGPRKIVARTVSKTKREPWR